MGTSQSKQQDDGSTRILARIQIRKDQTYDFIFADVKNVPSVYKNIFGNPSPNDYDYNKQAFQKEATFLSSKDRDWVCNEVSKICDCANQKRNKLRKLTRKNPFLSYSFRVCLLWSDLVKAAFNPRNICSLILWIPSVYIMIALLVTVYPLLWVFAKILDLLCCGRAAKSVEWMNALMDSNPDLDTNVIDDEVAEAMQSFVQIMKTKSDKIVEYHNEVETVEFGSSPSYDVDVFECRFSSHPTSLTVVRPVEGAQRV
jgi:hypothetical protein